jgi:pimeloyl-ACP methyl ester carboxylesterase
MPFFTRQSCPGKKSSAQLKYRLMKVYAILSLIFFAIACKPGSGISTGNNFSGRLEPRQVKVNGLTFNYIDAGSGNPVILIHGSISDYREWSKQIPSLSQHYHVIAYSRRYHPPNPPSGSDADASLGRQVNDLFAIIKALGIGPVSIIGHSYGGAVALGFILQHPELVERLVLVEPAVSSVIGKTAENDAVVKESQAVRAQMKEVFASGDRELIVKTYADHVAPGDFEKATREERKMLLENATAFELDFNSQRPPFTCEDAKNISVPVLVLAGDQSPMGLQRIAETTAKCIQGAKFVRIPRATHWVQHDQPQMFDEEVLAFLRDSRK